MATIAVSDGAPGGGPLNTYGVPGDEYVQYPLNTSHPLIPNSNQYTVYRKYVSIESVARNVIKEPNSNAFSIMLPQPVENVAAVRLAQWSFPSNYNVFSIANSNLGMTFQINNPYNPGAAGLASTVQNAVFVALNAHVGENFVIVIEEGFYNPIQMATELTNKMNEVITQYVIEYMGANGMSAEIAGFDASGGYAEFVVMYHSVGQKIWFGNKSSQFILTTSTQLEKDYLGNNIKCSSRREMPDFSDWGLPGNLGLSRCDTDSVDPSNNYVRVYYGDVFPGDAGYWLTPDLSGAYVSYIECPFKINFMGPSYIYMELLADGDVTLNSIDETAPYNLSKFTIHTNETNGTVNGSFAKIAVTTTPLAQWFDSDAMPYKLITPAAERMRKLTFRFRYHNGREVDFASFPFSFLLEFTQLLPRQTRAKYINNYQN